LECRSGESFPSDDYTDCTSEAVFYLSEESSNSFSIKAPKSMPACEVTNNNSEDHPELQRIGHLLIRKCYSKLCLHHLTATDNISAKVDYLSQTRSAQRTYLFTSLRKIAVNVDPAQLLQNILYQEKRYMELLGPNLWPLITDLIQNA